MIEVQENGSRAKMIPVMLMAYKENGDIDAGCVERLIDFYLNAGASALFTNCYSTEMFCLTSEERIRNAHHVVKYVNGKVPVVSVGTFGQTIKENIDNIKEMHDTGVDSVIMVAGQIVKPGESDAVFIKNLELILSQTGNIRLGLYECPLPYKRIISPSIYRYLRDSNRIVYHKDTSCDLDNVSEKLDIMKGSAIHFYDAYMPNAISSLNLGATGISSISANFYPEVVHWVCENHNNPERHEDLRFMEEEFARVDGSVHYGYPVNAKYFLRLRGLDISSKSRFREESFNRDTYASLENLLKTFYGWCERLGIDINLKASLQ